MSAVAAVSRCFRPVLLLVLGAAALPLGCAGPQVTATVPTVPTGPSPELVAARQENEELKRRLAAEQQAREERDRQVADLSARLAEAQAAVEAARRNSADPAALDAALARVRNLEKQLSDLSAAPLAVLPPDVNAAIAELARKHGLSFDERRGMVRLPGDLLFASGSDQVSAEGQAVLKKVAAVLDRPELREFTIRVEGHTDKRPITHPETARKFPSNWHLSAARAIAVVAELIRDSRSGRDAASLAALKRRFETVGHGQQKLLAEGDSPADHKRNRRVEIFLVPPAKGLAAAGLRPAAAPAGIP